MGSNVFTGLNAATVKLFGETVTYTPIAGPAASVTGIFDDEVPEPNNPGLLAKFFAPLSAFAATPARGSTITRSTGDAFKVTKVSADNGGGLILDLKHA